MHVNSLLPSGRRLASAALASEPNGLLRRGSRWARRLAVAAGLLTHYPAAGQTPASILGMSPAYNSLAVSRTAPVWIQLNNGLNTSPITAVVPVGATTGPVSVTTASGSGTPAAAFTVLQIHNGILNQCLTTVPVNSTGSGQWQWLLADNGQLVAALNDRRNALGTVAAEFTQAQLAAVRTDARGTEYLDRNWHLTADNAFAGQSVDVRFYGLLSEWNRFVAANDGDLNDATSLTQLRLTQYAGNNENCSFGDNTAPTQVRLLTPTVASSLSGGNWFVVEAPVPDHFSEFYLNGGTMPLPVELTSFTAGRQGDDALLHWTTAQELNNDHFEVEASADGQTFRPVGRVAGQATVLSPIATLSPTPGRYTTVCAKSTTTAKGRSALSLPAGLPA
ncbi:hypothetical protein LJ737_04455 [Hymenobacter sp. 15J16-1T3B]|uniref:hypothetical protein n=1 Tax=Hymenobacter sp. 15J16-1T3B TaxID=2886941 RepID=UPI001D1292A2|nr:hypothetical protein [Hymenobacter sp. 15J16-1T3B]MCC3156475.1 hypothetical protein [Hymenobacter sp. 15J16-1T3B]